MNESGRGLSWEGIQLVWVILGFIGAALGIGSMPTMTRKQLITAMLSGLVAAALAPQWAAHLYGRWFGPEPIPPFMNNTIAFFFGIGGMFIVPGAIVFWQNFRNNPLGFIDWIRGKGPPPPPPPAGPAGEHP